MARDKVYVRIAEDDNFGTASIEQRPFTEAYIRKGALLKWAKGEIMPGNSAEGKGWNWAIQTLIDKIESL